MVRSMRNQPFCWQEKKVTRLIRKKFQKSELVKMLLLYQTITEIDSDFNGKPIKYYTKTISTYSGLSKEFIPKGLKQLEKICIIHLQEERKQGQFMGRLLFFTPEKVLKQPKQPYKPIQGKPINGQTVALEDSKELEDSKRENLSSTKQKKQIKEIKEIKKTLGSNKEAIEVFNLFLKAGYMFNKDFKEWLYGLHKDCPNKDLVYCAKGWSDWIEDQRYNGKRKFNFKSSFRNWVKRERSPSAMSEI